MDINLGCMHYFLTVSKEISFCWMNNLIICPRTCRSEPLNVDYLESGFIPVFRAVTFISPSPSQVVVAFW